MKRLMAIAVLAFAVIPADAQATVCASGPPPRVGPCPRGTGVGRVCGFNSATDVTREAGWQTGVVTAGPLVVLEEGTLVCTVIVNSNSHLSTQVRARHSFTSIGGVVVGAEPLNYQATAADDIALCTKWVGASGTLYWTPTGEVTGDWTTDPGAPCETRLTIEPNDPECSIWKAIDRRLGTNIAEVWQDCEPYDELPLPI